MTNSTTEAVQTREEPAVDDLYWRDRYEPVTEDDAFLRNIVDTSDLPALMVALAAVTGDFSILRDDLRPPQPPADIVGQPHGGMSPEQQAQARALAFDALKRVREEHLTSVGTLTAERAEDILTWITNAANPEYHPMLMHDMALVEGKSGKPAWDFSEISLGREFSVAVIGSGVSGMAAAYRLKQAGIPYTVFEKGHTVGGTWWKNTYPGVRLDTPNYAYSFSFAQRDDWPQQFSQGSEIFEYTRQVAERGGILGEIEFNTEVTSASYDEAAGLWNVDIIDAEGRPVSRQFNAVLSAVGQLDRPKYPDVPGREDFAGIQMHSAEWDNSVDVTGKRVAVIGTGASAYQIVPAIVDQVSALTVFQRSSPWMLPTQGYYADMPDSVQWLVRKLPHYGQWLRFWQHWLGVEGRQHTTVAEPGWNQPGSVSAVNAKWRQGLTDILAKQYQDRPDLLAKVTPDYIVGGKRMLRDNGVWAESLKKPQSTLVTDGIERMTPEGIVTKDGVLHQVDIIVYATGFQASEFLEPLKITGLNGTDLHEYWGGDAKAFAGLTVPHFPNLFIITGPNTGHVVNGSLYSMIEYGVEYILESLRLIIENDLKALDLKQEVLDEFVAGLDAANATKAWGHPSVHTWYKNKFGRVSQIWPHPVLDFWKITRTVNLDHYNRLA
ncbi:NAD(P)/FAD-dependent oxidoreductase [Pseudarthrobacter sulfonivorans]|uniref:flavin-containing monooxygenase n=1 Tax=Pseudarthrobacter sulfonivorans TaxID=121292 RepID=UPI002859D493|nr:NAD(P)/FAD-dependent oxidoreductase [Pseudarthrobacter sulfonivorans]MDR6415631.1 4-hydroxyacetophenone monooxygenase [Pseudarthrobacter sulfonivorans]